LEGLNSPSYSILNKDGNLAPPILSGFIAPKLALTCRCGEGSVRGQLEHAAAEKSTVSVSAAREDQQE
jgi:hypothetical protein